jgi:DNA-binding HxlR family transcriptional regulator
VRGYGQYCPIARGAEIFAERWTPIIIRDLIAGCSTFGGLQRGAPGIPRSVLSQRLRALERAGVLDRRMTGTRATYHLTDCGRELAAVCDALGAWGARWLETGPEHMDAHLALWFWTGLVDRDALPEQRVVVRFDLTDGARPDRYWVLLSRAGTEVCARSPGFAEDLVVTTDTRTLIAWHSGTLSLAAAVRAGAMRFAGPPSLVRAFGRWGGLSPFAGVRPAGRTGPVKPVATPAARPVATRRRKSG